MASAQPHLPPEIMHEICSYFPLSPGVVTILYKPCVKTITAKLDGVPRIMGANSATYKNIILYAMKQGMENGN